MSVLLLMPTTTYRADDFLSAAGRLGIEVIIATDRCHVLAQDFSEEATGSVAIEFLPVDKGVAALIELHKRRPFCAIVAVDDATTTLAGRAAAALGLRHNDPAAILAARDKRVMRERLQQANIAQPAYQVLSVSQPAAQVLEAALHVGFPCVLKPAMLSASQGVIRADDPAGLEAAHDRIRSLLTSPEIRGKQGDAAMALLCEAFVPGQEVAIEALLLDGELVPLAIFDKPDPLDGPFFEETLYVTPSRHPAAVQRAILETTGQAARALGLRHGPVHAELRLCPANHPLALAQVPAVPVLQRGRDTSPVPFVIEVAARSIGGLCSRTLRFGTDRSLEELILLSAIGAPLQGADLRREEAAAGVMMLPIPRAGVLAEIHGLEEARSVKGVVEVTVTARKGQELIPLPEGSAYLGFVFARGDTPGQVEAALRKAHGSLHFAIHKTLPTRSRHGDTAP